nr:hypothetical protein RVX_1384 [Nitratidesulfovibrio sp. HK-II]
MRGPPAAGDAARPGPARVGPAWAHRAAVADGCAAPGHPTR